MVARTLFGDPAPAHHTGGIASTIPVASTPGLSTEPELHVRTEFSALDSENGSEPETEDNSGFFDVSAPMSSNLDVQTTDFTGAAIVDESDTVRCGCRQRLRFSELQADFLFGILAILSQCCNASFSPRFEHCRDAVNFNSTKQPKSSFMLFYHERFKEKRGFYPDKSAVETAQMLGQEWKALPEEDKAQYVSVGDCLPTVPESGCLYSPLSRCA